MAYSVELTSRAETDLRRLLRGAEKTDRNHLRGAFAILKLNPYPTNPDIPKGLIRHLQGTRKWRLKVGYRHRMIYRVEGHTMIVERIAHRREVYRDL